MNTINANNIGLLTLFSAPEVSTASRRNGLGRETSLVLAPVDSPTVEIFSVVSSAGEAHIERMNPPANPPPPLDLSGGLRRNATPPGPVETVLRWGITDGRVIELRLSGPLSADDWEILGDHVEIGKKIAGRAKQAVKPAVEEPS